MQLIKTGFIINKFFVNAKAKNIAVIGVREHPATKAPIPAKMYVPVSYTHLTLPTNREV